MSQTEGSSADRSQAYSPLCLVQLKGVIVDGGAIRHINAGYDADKRHFGKHMLDRLISGGDLPGRAYPRVTGAGTMIRPSLHLAAGDCSVERCYEAIARS